MMDKQQAQKIADEYYEYGAVFSDDVDDVLIFRQRVPKGESAIRGVGSVIVYADGRSEQLSSSPIMWPDWYADWVGSLDG